jgi:hypothetical protein
LYFWCNMNHFSWLGLCCLHGREEWKWREFDPISLIELVLEFDPEDIGRKYHCKRRACKKHSIKSIIMRTPRVQWRKTGQPMKMVRNEASSIPAPIHFEKNTLANWPWARERAQRRRYEAVFEMDPKNRRGIINLAQTQLSQWSSARTPHRTRTRRGHARVHQLP